MKQTKEMIDFLAIHKIGESTTKKGTDYWIMPASLHKIRYFIIADSATRVVAISNEVPEKFRDFWVDHELPCVDSNYDQCHDLTIGELRESERLFTAEELRLFLRMRIALYETAIQLQPNHPFPESMKRTLSLLHYSLREVD